MPSHITTSPGSHPPLAYTIEELGRISTVSRSQIYIEIAEGRLIASRIGRRRLVTHHHAVRWLASLPTSATVDAS